MWMNSFYTPAVKVFTPIYITKEREYSETAARLGKWNDFLAGKALTNF